MIRTFTLENEQGFHPSAVEAPAGPGSSRFKNLDGQAFRHIVL